MYVLLYNEKVWWEEEFTFSECLAKNWCMNRLANTLLQVIVRTKLNSFSLVNYE